MTTTASGGKITGLLALTMATDVALQVGDYVHIVGDYKVGLANGTKPVLGEVSVRSVKRTSTATSETFPVVGTTGSQVTVEARGLSVSEKLAGAAIVAGVEVGINSSGAIVTLAGGVSKIGIALTAASGAGQPFDVLHTTA